MEVAEQDLSRCQYRADEFADRERRERQAIHATIDRTSRRIARDQELLSRGKLQTSFLQNWSCTDGIVRAVFRLQECSDVIEMSVEIKTLHVPDFLAQCYDQSPHQVVLRRDREECLGPVFSTSHYSDFRVRGQIQSKCLAFCLSFLQEKARAFAIHSVLRSYSPSEYVERVKQVLEAS